ncbi:phosphotyrosine protein phosphatase [Stenotrophomonas sp.]|uniref:low molecular weight protein tyrosine phosphatase family protein n=1 Tax=Stenotrophomonas sp. TaxID=69392 RepID=UPI002899948B|nr:phosphotyrosine protein phosphatase [Stenotrophomonas sp.]
MINLLFVCSRNQLRSPTAEAIWRRRPGFSARSAGTSPHARRPISAHDLRWADVIFVMEAKHQQRLRAQFARLLLHTPLHCLDIPDDYACMDPALMALLEARVGACLAEGVGPGA